MTPRAAIVALLAVGAGLSTASAQPQGRIDRVDDIAPVLADCWEPPAAGPIGERTEITVRLAFRRDGRLLGEPRVTYTTRPLPEGVREAYRASVTDMVRRCLPLRFGPGLGEAIAGRPFSLRLIHTDTRPERRT